MAVGPLSPSADREQLRRIRRTAFARGATLDASDVVVAEKTLASLRGASPRFRVALVLSACFFAWFTFRDGFESHRHGHWVLFAVGLTFVVLGLAALAADILLARRLRKAIRRARLAPPSES